MVKRGMGKRSVLKKKRRHMSRHKRLKKSRKWGKG